MLRQFFLLIVRQCCLILLFAAGLCMLSQAFSAKGQRVLTMIGDGGGY